MRKAKVWRSWLLLPLVALAVLGLAAVSEAGARRGLTVRYVLPLLLPLAAALGGLLAALARRSRLAAAAVLLAVLAFNVSGYFLPGSPARRRWEERREADTRLVAFLAEQGIDVVTGDYWSAYPMNFLTRERVRAVPFQPGVDFYAYEAAMPDVPHRWAVLGRSYADLERLAVRAGFSGAIAKLGEERFAFVPEENPPKTPATNDLLGRFREAYFSP